jgi:hypothetical protein
MIGYQNQFLIGTPDPSTKIFFYRRELISTRSLAVKNLKLWVIVVSSLLILSAACARKEEPSAKTEPATTSPLAANLFDPAKGSATVSGKVLFEGTAPPAAQIRLSADPVCVSLHKDPLYSEELQVNNGNLLNVFVYVKEGLEKYSFAPPREPATLAQQGCRFEPHVGGVMVNQDLRIVNNDPTLHNVRCVAENNPQFNIGQPIQGGETVKRLAHPEVMIRFRCDVHKWMSSYLGVLPHPYYSVTGKDGSFTLKNLPPGEYVIEAWHEKLGTQSQKVVVGDKETKEISFSFKAS